MERCDGTQLPPLQQQQQLMLMTLAAQIKVRHVR